MKKITFICLFRVEERKHGYSVVVTPPPKSSEITSIGAPMDFQQNTDYFMDDDGAPNPWSVENLEEFLYFCCPECDEKNQSKDMFIKHALNHHPKSKELNY